MRTVFFFSPLLLFLVAACDEESIYTSSLEIPNGKWDHENLLTYEVEVEDTSERFDLVLDVLHSTAYEYQNLYVNINTTYPDGNSRQQRLSVDMAAPTGQWYGNCNRSQCKLRVVLQENAFFNQHGRHQFQVEQYMREDPLVGIYSITFSLLQGGSLGL